MLQYADNLLIRFKEEQYMLWVNKEFINLLYLK